MAGFLGMVSEDVRTVARQVEQEASKLQTDIAAIGSKITGVQWKGPDREKFVADWGQQKAQVTKVCEMLRQTARTMTLNADQQDHTSSR